MTRTRSTLAAVALALAAPATAQDPSVDGSAAPPAQPPSPPAPRGADGGIDVRARVRSIPGGVALELDGTTLELRVAEGAPPPSARTPAGAHELRATVTVDGQERGFSLRVVPPPQRAEDL